MSNNLPPPPPPSREGGSRRTSSIHGSAPPPPPTSSIPSRGSVRGSNRAPPSMNGPSADRNTPPPPPPNRNDVRGPPPPPNRVNGMPNSRNGSMRNGPPGGVSEEDDFENRFQFNQNLSNPEPFQNYPKTYPSHNPKRGAGNRRVPNANPPPPPHMHA
uniref:Adaptin ear-binding coat-associated protein 1 n=1 Tax=Phallusia mammillata TaxID=59560 RepID=A0A6F9DMC0_9ASCI|nr:adaptin ear-binding coat-associated protein 1 [Phallusia mammillata]